MEQFKFLQDENKELATEILKYDYDYDLNRDLQILFKNDENLEYYCLDCGSYFEKRFLIEHGKNKIAMVCPFCFEGCHFISMSDTIYRFESKLKRRLKSRKEMKKQARKRTFRKIGKILTLLTPIALFILLPFILLLAPFILTTGFLLFIIGLLTDGDY